MSVRVEASKLAGIGQAGQLRRTVARHPSPAFFVLAYTYSWVCWAPAALGANGALPGALVFVGVWGPAAAAATVTHLAGRSVRVWLRGMLSWRHQPRWYAYAFGVPIALVAVVSVAFVLAGNDLDGSLLGQRLASYVPMLVFLSLLGGGNEEWGWRGFALPELLKSKSPLSATFVLGTLWALWHLPLLAAQDDLSHGLDGLQLSTVLAATVIAIVAHAVLYTYLYQHTHSALLAMVLHGSFNAANGNLVLRDEIEGSAYATMQYCITATMWALALFLIWRTHSRLGPADGVAIEDSRGPADRRR